jgi:F-type H+-transporting ATPase subunit b
MKAMHDRQKRIAEGLASAERGVREQELAKAKSADVIRAAKQQSTEIIAQAQKRANEIIEESKNEARAEGERQLAAAQAQIAQEMNRAREQLRSQVADLAIEGAGKVLKQEINATSHARMLDELVAQL